MVSVLDPLAGRAEATSFLICSMPPAFHERLPPRFFARHARDDVAFGQVLHVIAGPRAVQVRSGYSLRSTSTGLRLIARLAGK